MYVEVFVCLFVVYGIVASKIDKSIRNIEDTIAMSQL